MCLSNKHFARTTKYYLTKDDTMSPEDLAGFELLKA
ncbi:hypothetical protein A2U01_0064020, partial [Trifolium medium]|nr:hypothetical protein [Trifolium medium]